MVSAILAGSLSLAASDARAYQTADLQGAWWFHALASGPDAPWWEYAQAAIAPDGSLTASTTSSAGDTSSFAATFALSPAGIVSLAVAPRFHGALDAGKTVLVSTDVWDPVPGSTTEMRIGLKTVGGYRVQDLAGDWEVQSLASGPGAPWWQRGRISISSTGTLSGIMVDPTGAPDTANGTLAVSIGGVISFLGSATHGAVDAGHTVIATTSTWTGFAAGTTDLTIGLRMGTNYSLSDLAGTWEFHSLATGPGSPFSSRGSIIVAANGSFTGSVTTNSGANQPLSGSFAISSTGVVTRVGSATVRGALDAGRTVMALTEVWTTGSPGTSELLIAVRTAGSNLDIPPATRSAVALSPVWPNPVSGGRPSIRFSLASDTPARLEVLDASGRLRVVEHVRRAGADATTWSLPHTARLEPGLYWVRLAQDEHTAIRRFVVLD